MKFSTIDQDDDHDHDHHVSNCAERCKGAWWYNDFNAFNLNGLCLSGPEAPCTKGVNWFTFRGYSYSLKRTEMKVTTKA